MTQFNRITFDPNIMGGRACIRGMAGIGNDCMKYLADREGKAGFREFTA